MMIFLYVLLIVTVFGSGSLIFLVRSDNRKLLKLLLAFSGAFLISISFLQLIPEVFSSTAKYAGLFVLFGFVLQLVLEVITEGAEHGHNHVHHEDERVSPFLLLIGLCIHAFLEGMPIIGTFNKQIQHSLAFGIIIHNIPISITLMSLFIHYGCSKTKAFLYLGIFALMTPLGSLVSCLIQSNIAGTSGTAFYYIMAVVIGIFLHVSTSILFETEENHKYNIQKFSSVGLGIFVAFCLTLL
jgi:zinc and cadmium transporter